MRKIKSGDRITFTTAAAKGYQAGAFETVSCVVTGVLVNGNPTVKLGDQDNFIVLRSEVTEVDPR